MSTYETLPTDDLVRIDCFRSGQQNNATLVNDHIVAFPCTEVLNQYYKRDYEVNAHSLAHEPDGWLNTSYFVGSWTMSKRRSLKLV